jgi:hypothetical protein
VTAVGYVALNPVGEPLTASAISAGGAFPVNHHCRHCNDYFTRSRNRAMMTHRWMKGAHERPAESGCIRIAWANRKGSIKRQGFVRHSRHEGLAPVRLA